MGRAGKCAGAIMINIHHLTHRELSELVVDLAWNDAFRCFTRAGFEQLIWPRIAQEADWLVYFDVDSVHELNETHGPYDVFDAMMKEVLSIVRNSDYVAGQLKSGHEFLLCITDSDDRAPVDPGGIVM